MINFAKLTSRSAVVWSCAPALHKLGNTCWIPNTDKCMYDKLQTDIPRNPSNLSDYRVNWFRSKVLFTRKFDARHKYLRLAYKL